MKLTLSLYQNINNNNSYYDYYENKVPKKIILLRKKETLSSLKHISNKNKSNIINSCGYINNN